MSHRNFLLIVDDTPINDNLKDYFAKFNLDIKQQKILHPIQIDQSMPTAILINWSLLKNEPDSINQLYHSYSVPLIIISETDDEEACIAVLENGADDFMIKPLYPRELHARISAISRRVTKSQHNEAPGKEILKFSHWKLLPASRQVFDANNIELQLSAGEYDLLFTFVQQPQQILDREFLLQVTKSSDLNPFDRRIDVQISRLRQKIEYDAKKPVLIKTIRNGGYMFTATVETLRENDGD